jgi:uncharacterized membrane protein
MSRMLRTPSNVLLVLVAVNVAASSAGAAPSAIFRPLEVPSGMFSIFASAISADGSTVVGTAYGPEGLSKGFRWTPAAGATEPEYLTPCAPSCLANDVSADGSTIVGATRKGGGAGNTPTIWSVGGAEVLPIPRPRFDDRAELISDDGSFMVVTSTDIAEDLPVNGYTWTRAQGYTTISSPYSGITPHDISTVGNVVVGQTGYPFGPVDAFRWTPADGVQVLGTTADEFRESTAYATNADGSLLVGTFLRDQGGDTFRWTPESGLTLLDMFGDDERLRPSAMSGDGSVIVGQAIFDGTVHRAAIWDPSHGTRTLADVLTLQGADLAGWTLFNVVDITPDGSKIIGGGFSADRRFAAWYAEFVVPEPPFAVLLAGLLPFANWPWAWRRAR